MKDAFGGAFVLRIMLIFFVVFICFMTVAINFAKTFRIKNNVINILEKSANGKSSETYAAIEKYLKDISYSYGTSVKVKKDCDKRLEKSKITNDSVIISGNIRGVCVVPIGTKDSYYYRVTSYIVLDFPLFRLGTVIPISGESKTIDNTFY